MKYSYSDYSDGNCTWAEYCKQFNPIKLELGKVYKQRNLAKWAETHYKIVYLDDTIALGVSIYCAIDHKTCLGRYELFKASTGFKYDDNRIETYQLIDMERD